MIHLAFSPSPFLTWKSFLRRVGIIPRDGRNIAFRELSAQIRATYNFSPSFCVYTLRFIANILNRSYKTGRFDLSDIDVHNGIEHDASLVRKCQNNNLFSPTLALFVPPPHTSPKLLKYSKAEGYLDVCGQGVTYSTMSTRACPTPHW